MKRSGAAGVERFGRRSYKSIMRVLVIEQSYFGLHWLVWEWTTGATETTSEQSEILRAVCATHAEADKRRSALIKRRRRPREKRR